VLLGVVGCCSVLQGVARCCRLLQCVAEYFLRRMVRIWVGFTCERCVAGSWSVLQFVFVCLCVYLCVEVWCSVWHCVAICYRSFSATGGADFGSYAVRGNELQGVAVGIRVL